MDDILNTQGEQVPDLDSMFPEPTPTIKPPINAIRTRASTMALLSEDPNKRVETYQAMVAEGEQGDNSLYKMKQEMVAQTARKLDMKGVLSILSDATIPMERKQAAIESIKNSPLLSDDKVLLATNSLAAPSKNEKPEQESARITISESLGDMSRSAEERQALINAHGAQLDDLSSKTFFEMLELYVMPFGNNINAGKIRNAIAEKQGIKLSPWQRIKNYIFAGSATAETAQILQNVPVDKRAEFTQALIDTISKNSGILFSNNNQFAQFDKAQSILQEGGYSDTQKWLDNITPLIDLIGVGQAIRGGSRILRPGAKTAEAAKTIDPAKLPTSPQVPDGVILPSAPAPKPPMPSREAPKPIHEKLIEQKIEEDKKWFTGSTSSGRTETRTLDEQATKKNADQQFAGPGQYITTDRGLAGTYGGKEGRAYQVEAPFDNPFVFETVDPTTRKSNKTLYDEMVKELGSKTAANKKLAEQDYDAILFKNSQGQEIANIFNKKKLTDIGPAREPVKSFGELKLVDDVERVEINSTVRTENPVSPAKIIQQTNPEQAKEVFKSVFESVGDEVAQALYGTSKLEAIASDILPQATTRMGAVVSRVANIQPSLKDVLDIPDELVDIMHSSGAMEFTKEEKAAARANVVNDFNSVKGITINDAMSSFAIDGGRIKISAVYGVPGGSWLRAEDAITQTLEALKGYGVRLDEITLLKKDGIDHVPVDAASEIGKDGNYLIRVDTYHDIDPTDVGRMFEPDVKRNAIDRISPWVPMLTDPARWVADAASMLHPVYTGAASNAIDLTSRFDKYMLDMANQYAERWKSLSKSEKDAVNLYIREANFKELKFDPVDLKARGFTDDQIEAVRSWRKFWDAHYYLENYDVVKTLNAGGYELFDNGTDRLVAKSIAKNTTLGGELNGNRIVGGSPIYNPDTGNVVTLTKSEIDDLYNNGGTLARLRRSADFNGITAELIIVRNTNTSYLRKIRESDSILNYRDGYFQLQYKAPKFVDEVTRENGKIVKRKAIAVAGDTAEAEAFASRSRSVNQNANVEYVVRGDDRAMQRGSDDWWDIHSATGRIAQRQRGKLLEDASGMNHLGDGDYILNPVESAIRSARSIAGRTAMRPVLETARARFVQQYSDLLFSDGRGGFKYPSSLSEIGSKGEFTSSRVADARTTWQYIHYLENGYINGIDNFLKAALNYTADTLGKLKLSKAERVIAGAAEDMVGPVALAKSTTFHAFLGTNPLRQLIIQPHQVVRTWAYNPIGWITGGIIKYAGGYPASKLGIPVSKDVAAFSKWLDESGMLDSVDRQNLVRGALVDAAESQNRVMRMFGKSLAVPRKIGFDTGEMANLIGHSAAVWDRYKRLGKDLSDKAIRAEAHSEVRALTYEMNFAGDMPYNQTSAAMVLQFMQVPHKAFLQMTNRKLDRVTRARLITGDLLFWGPPTFLISEIFGGDILPDDPKLREAFSWGLEGILLNEMFTSLFGEDTKIDWSGLAPYDMTGWANFFTAMREDGMGTMLTNSPAGQLFLKEGSRFHNAMKSMGRYFAGFVEEQQQPETFLSMLHEMAKISSGYNNAQEAYSESIRAQLAIDAIERLDKYGNAIDRTVTNPESIARMFGFGTIATRDLYAIAKITSKDNKQYNDEVRKVYNSIRQYYAKELPNGANNPEFITSVTGALLHAFRDDPVAQEMVYKQWVMDMQTKDQQLLYQMMKRSDIPNAETFKDDVRRSPLSEEQKQMLIERIDSVKNAREQLKALQQKEQ